MITFEQWKQAQVLERQAHTRPRAELLQMYRNSYNQYFGFLNMKKDQNYKKILEIGCADIPALYFCANYQGFIIEPMESSILNDICHEKHIYLIQEMAEICEWPADIDEVWLFNILQHTLSPEIIINKAKIEAKIIRFFEPINFGVDRKHLHNFTLAYFKQCFNDTVNYYPPNSNAVDFHTHECCYGSFECNK